MIEPEGDGPPAGGSRVDAARRLADAVRTLIERTVGTAAPAEVFEEVAAELRAAARRFEGYPQEHLYLGVAESALAGAATPGEDFEGPFDKSPLLGRANPLAPPLHLVVSDGAVTGRATFGSAYEGPPGCVHGGYVAAAFDELLGMAQRLGGNPGMTGRLTVRYRSPTPLHTELRLDGRLDRVDGRKTICTGTIRAGDQLCAEAEGLFVAVDFSKLRELAARADKQLGEPPAR